MRKEKISYQQEANVDFSFTRKNSVAEVESYLHVLQFNAAARKEMVSSDVCILLKFADVYYDT